MNADQTLLTQFENATWPREQWHHREHVKVAYLYLRQYTFAEALPRLRARLQAYNAAHAVPDALDRGYHETITRAWLWLVHVTLSEYGPADNADAFCDAHPHLLSANVLRLFYSRERIASAEARRQFVEPDLTPLPDGRQSIPR